jgi:hypothetical protein
MYLPLLHTHSALRWVALALLVAGSLAALSAWLGKKPLAKSHEKLGLFAMIALDVQTTLGLVLYAVSPLLTAFFGDPKANMKVPGLRFFAVEHATLMLLAVAAVHVGRILSKRAPDAGKARPLAVGLTLSLVLVLAGIPWPGLPHGRPLLPGPRAAASSV